MSGIEITPVAPQGVNLIHSYGNGGFRVGADISHSGSLMVSADHLADWQHGPLDALSMDDLKPVVDAMNDINILVFGCGEKFSMPPKSLRDGLRDHGIVLEWMDTGAACRTYNVLLSEGRQVAAALIAID